MTSAEAAPHVATATYLVEAARSELFLVMNMCESHGLFGELKAQNDLLQPVALALSEKRDELAAVSE